MAEKMSIIENMIDELCPDGVEWKTLGDVASYRRGSFPQPYGKSEWYDGEEAMPFVQVFDVSANMLLVKNTKKRISKLAQPKSVFVPAGTVIVTLQGSIGRVAITQYDSYVDRTLAIFESFKIEINKKYFAYQLQRKFGIEKESARGSTIKTITKEELTKFIIPIPPLAIQREIVKILDIFTTQEAELEAKLEAELEARKKQYEYYRDELLTFGDDVEWTTLGEIGKWFGGGTPSKSNSEYWRGGIIPWLSPKDMKAPIIEATEDYITESAVANSATKLVPANSVAIVVRSSILDKVLPVAFVPIPITLNQDMKAVVAHADVFPNFIAHIVRSHGPQVLRTTRKTGGSVASIEVPKLMSYPIPIPPLAEQERIVAILDKFDALVNDISVGLPAELNARRKQYEYYRNKLLTFKPLEEAHAKQ
jgi:type I restriction enzyme, S subunit